MTASSTSSIKQNVISMSMEFDTKHSHAPVIIKPTYYDLQRLEYGKLCEMEGGRILREIVEHRQLGYSSGFPQELVNFATPSIFGRSIKSGDDLPFLEQSTSTVIWPLEDGNQMFFQIRDVPEKGTGTESRLYTLARYVFIPSTIPWDPQDLIVHELGIPRGITSEQAENITPLRVIPPPHPTLKDKDAPVVQFLEEAVIYAMSGIPISITSPISEGSFFTLASALKELIPPGLKTSFAVGYGVSRTLSSLLSLSYTTSHVGNNYGSEEDAYKYNCAEFRYDKETPQWQWHVPFKAFNAERQLEQFNRDHVRPGALYASYLFDRKLFRLPKIDFIINGDWDLKRLYALQQKASEFSLDDWQRSLISSP